MKRIIHKETNLFIRDDFSHNPETEIALEAPPVNGKQKAKWSGELKEYTDEEGQVSYKMSDGEWIEAMTEAEIEAIKAQSIPSNPTIEERVTSSEDKIVTIEEQFDVIFGGE